MLDTATSRTATRKPSRRSRLTASLSCSRTGSPTIVSPGDDVTASLWNEGDDVLLCGDTIIHKDDGEQVDVTPH